MLTFVLLLPALVLIGLGAAGLYNADRESQADFIIAGLELAGAVLLIGLAVVLRRRVVPEPEVPALDSADRAEVIERLRRHTEALRLAEEEAAGTSLNPVEPPAPVQAPTQPTIPTVTPLTKAGATRADTPISTGVRLPALMLLNVTATAQPADIEAAPPLGPKDQVMARLREVLPDLEVDEKGRSHHTGPDHSVHLDIGAHQIVHTIVLEAAGETGISLVRWLLDITGWRAFVPKSGRFVEADGLDALAVRDAG
jgi:hypothetical protein